MTNHHRQDEDCTPDPATGLCTDCGTLHGDPCAACEARGFHRDNCPIYLQTLNEQYTPTMSMHCVFNPVVLAYIAVCLLITAWLTEIGLHLHN
jgi:hypothetical protein